MTFELPPEAEVPAGIRAAVAWSERINGTGDERDAMLWQLAERRPHRLLLVCHAGSTPDRGTQRFLADTCMPPTAVLLLAATGTATATAAA